MIKNKKKLINYLYFTHLHKGSVGFTRLSNGSTAQERLWTPILQVASSDDTKVGRQSPTFLQCHLTFNAQWFLQAPPGVTLTNTAFFPHYNIFIWFVLFWQLTAIISLYNRNRLILVTEAKSVYFKVGATFIYVQVLYHI